MKDEEWRKLAEQNPMRVTYPSWRPKEYWEAKSKADPWVLMNGTKDWRKADAQKARSQKITDGFIETRPALPPSGMKLDFQPRPAWHNPPKESRRRRESL